MAKVRVEWVRLSAPGYGRGAEANDLSAILAAQVLSVSSTPVQSAAAPNFGDGLVGFARVGGITGAVNVDWGGGVAGETLGVRIAAGQTVLIEVAPGQTLSLVEAADPPSPASTQDGPAETALTGILAALQGTLAVSGPLTNAQLAAAGLSTAANQGTTNTALAAIQALLGGTLDVAAHPVQAEATSHSGAITAGGTAQDLMPANSARKGWRIQNQSTGDLYVRSKGAAGTTTATQDQNSFKIEAGATWTEDGHVTGNALSIIGAVTGQAFYAREW